MLPLTNEQLANLDQFISSYGKAKNAADGSTIDANANVTSKNIATLEGELFKPATAQLNVYRLKNKISSIYGTELADEFERQLNDHEIYLHDASSIKNYCASITLYPFLLSGMTKLGGDSEPPKHLYSFAGSFINLLYAVSAQLCGAVGTVEFLMYFDYFAAKDYGDDYLNTDTDVITQCMQHIIYSLNQPTATRGYQCPFWNISIFDREYFQSIFGEFVFPDDNLTKPSYDRIDKLQKFFMDWFNKERLHKLLTFPVVTAAALTQDGKIKDREFSGFMADEMAKGNSFFLYTSDNPDSLSSCCRLRSEFVENVFSNSLGAGGIATGSINVITINFNRMVQKGNNLSEQVIKIQKYQTAYREIAIELIKDKMYPIYDCGFVDFDKQFLTIGINGMLEAAEFLGLTPDYNTDYVNWLSSQLKIIYDLNKEFYVKNGFRINTEFVPAENLGVKNAKWDMDDGLKVNRDVYNSYFYPVESEHISPIDKILLHGKNVTKWLDGGSALHLNLEEYLSKEAYIKLFDACAKAGCNYVTTNVRISICNDCGFISKNTETNCPRCKSINLDYATRIIGYLKRVSSFSAERQIEADLRAYTVTDEV